jgi:hypothetical protein
VVILCIRVVRTDHEINGNPSAPSRAALEAANARDLHVVRRLQLRIGRRLQVLRARGVHRGEGCNSFRHYLERQGLGVVEGRQILRMAEAGSLDPRVAPKTEAGSIPARAGAALARVLAAESQPIGEPLVPTRGPGAAPTAPDRQGPADCVQPLAADPVSSDPVTSDARGAETPTSTVANAPAASSPPERDWVEEAERMPTEAFIDAVTEHLARRGATDLTRLTLHVGSETARRWRRTCRLMARSDQREVGDGEVLDRLVKDWLQRHDPRYARATRLRKRRGDAGDRPRTRHVPASVRAEVLERDGDRCCVPLCPDTAYLDFAHLHVRFADGGDATTGNLGRMCHGHNLMQEAGLLRVVPHPTGPIFVDAHGYVLERTRAPMAPRRRLEEFLSELSGKDPPESLSA